MVGSDFKPRPPMSDSFPSQLLSFVQQLLRACSDVPNSGAGPQGPSRPFPTRDGQQFIHTHLQPQGNLPPSAAQNLIHVPSSCPALLWFVLLFSPPVKTPKSSPLPDTYSPDHPHLPHAFQRRPFPDVLSGELNLKNSILHPQSSILQH